MDEGQMREALRQRRDPPNPMDGRELLRRARNRSHAGRAALITVAIVALAVPAALLLAPDDGERLAARGATGAEVELELVWLVEGASVERGGTAPVAADQQVVFVARSSRAGFLCLDERDGEVWRRVHPLEGELWTATVGRNLLVRDGVPQAFRTDLGSGPREYRLSLDDEQTDCGDPLAADSVVLQWLD
jgi:hypothetical protein